MTRDLETSRQKELKMLRKAHLLSCVSTISWYMTPYLVRGGGLGVCGVGWVVGGMVVGCLRGWVDSWVLGGWKVVGWVVVG